MPTTGVATDGSNTINYLSKVSPGYWEFKDRKIVDYIIGIQNPSSMLHSMSVYRYIGFPLNENEELSQELDSTDSFLSYLISHINEAVQIDYTIYDNNNISTLGTFLYDEASKMNLYGNISSFIVLNSSNHSVSCTDRGNDFPNLDLMVISNSNKKYLASCLQMADGSASNEQEAINIATANVESQVTSAQILSVINLFFNNAVCLQVQKKSSNNFKIFCQFGSNIKKIQLQVKNVPETLTELNRDVSIDFNYIIKGSDMQELANTIREKAESIDSLTFPQMITKIKNLSTLQEI